MTQSIIVAIIIILAIAYTIRGIVNIIRSKQNNNDSDCSKGCGGGCDGCSGMQ